MEAGGIDGLVVGEEAVGDADGAGAGAEVEPAAEVGAPVDAVLPAEGPVDAGVAALGSGVVAEEVAVDDLDEALGPEVAGLGGLPEDAGAESGVVVDE